MQRLGERIKRKRESQHMQLNDLARQVGISSSAVSQIENGKAFPSITTLKSISECLHTTVGELIGEHETLTKNPLIRRSDKRFVKRNKNGASLYLLSHHEHLKQMETYSIVLKEGADAGEIMINHPGQEFCHLIKGEIEFKLDSNTYHLRTGDSFYFNSGVAHSAKNAGNDEAEVIWIVTPPNI